MMLKVLGLSLYGPLAASTRYRLSQYQAGLRTEGIDLVVKGLLGDAYLQRTYVGGKYPLHRLVRDYASRLALLLRQGDYDLAIINAEIFPLLPGWIEARLLRIPYIYDFDDAFFLKYKLERFKAVSFLLHNKFEPVIRRAAAVFAGNSYLADYSLIYNTKTHVLPTVVDTTRYQVQPDRETEVFTIGWVGSPSTSVYLSELYAPLQSLGQEGHVRFVVVGGSAPPIPGVDVVNLPWSSSTEIALINTFDVGVMPLFNDDWARGKCAFKLIQYMACGVPVVASSVGANCEVVTPDCGFLTNGHVSWLSALRTLRDSTSLRVRMGEAGRVRVESKYSLQKTLPVCAEVIRQAAGKRKQ